MIFFIKLYKYIFYIFLFMTIKDDYYNYIIEIHNLKKWSPIISIDKDFLEFFQKINYFDFILEYK